ncbi:MAG: efflux RND transporter periplasmic adaptor subunit [Gemmatimonadetes bacterium]|nr:efflux RND transporter periplasmic adaptor subunit [Gemmatimonadota bacterium]
MSRRPPYPCITVLASPLLAALVACGSGDGAQAASAPGGRGGRGGEARVVPVEVLPVETGRIARSVTVSGNIEPIRTVVVNAQLAGALETVNVEEGTVVAVGAVLATLDDREISAQLASAEASYELADAAFERAQRLRDRQVITLAEYERDRAARASAEAQREQLRTRLGFATVTAAIAGVITEKLVEAGHAVGNQTRLFTIADVSTLVVRVRVSELDVVQIRPGDRVDVVLDAFPGQVLVGRVRRIFPAADPASRLVPVEVALSGADAATARPGFLARIAFALGSKENVRLVPASAIVSDGSGSTAVFVVENDVAARRSVRTGLTSEGRVEIVDGVETGEIVVVTGTNNLRDGTAVRVVNAAAAAEGGERKPDGGE